MDLYVHPPRTSTGADARLVDSLAALSRALVGITARTLADLDVDVTLNQLRTIVVLASRGPLRTVDLAAALHVHPSTVTRTCDRLTRRGLVVRHQGATDRRVTWLALTESGKDLVGEVMRRRAAHIRDLLRRPDTGPHGTDLTGTDGRRTGADGGLAGTRGSAGALGEVAVSAGALAEFIDGLVVASGEPTERLWWQRWERCAEPPPGVVT
jgi:DNA-binding MarR family transcriptional regulator